MLWLSASLRGLAWWPLLAAAVVGLAWYLWSVSRAAPKPAPSSRPSSRNAAATAAVLALLVGGAALVGHAAPPAPPPATVLVLPCPAGTPEKGTVLAPRDLLRQIDALASGTPRGAVLVSAGYEGKVSGDHAEFEGKLLVHSFDDGPATVALPFAGVRLQDDG